MVKSIFTVGAAALCFVVGAIAEKYYVSKETEKLNRLSQRASRYSGYLVLIFLLPI